MKRKRLARKTIRRIKYLLIVGYTIPLLAREFKVSIRTVRGIKAGRIYANIPPLSPFEYTLWKGREPFSIKPYSIWCKR
jgi:hypothetical protein